MISGVALGLTADGTFGFAVSISLALGTAVGTRRSCRLRTVVPAVVGISLFTFGRTVVEILFTAIRC